MKLYLLRHAEAVDIDEAGGDDAARKLTDAGEQSARRAARGMKRLSILPDKILTSPLVRAARTAELTARELGITKRVRENERLASGVPVEAMAELIGSRSEESLMLVGHNPDFELLLAWLISPAGGARVNLKKGALALVQVELPLQPGAGMLRWLMTPGQLAQLDRI